MQYLLGKKYFYLLIFFMRCMPVAMKPLTPLAMVINTVATPHPSRHFPVGSAALLTPLLRWGTRQAREVAHQPRSFSGVGALQPSVSC